MTETTKLSKNILTVGDTIIEKQLQDESVAFNTINVDNNVNVFTNGTNSYITLQHTHNEQPAEYVSISTSGVDQGLNGSEGIIQIYGYNGDDINANQNATVILPTGITVNYSAPSGVRSDISLNTGLIDDSIVSYCEINGYDEAYVRVYSDANNNNTLITSNTINSVNVDTNDINTNDINIRSYKISKTYLKAGSTNGTIIIHALSDITINLTLDNDYYIISHKDVIKVFNYLLSHKINIPLFVSGDIKITSFELLDKYINNITLNNNNNFDIKHNFIDNTPVIITKYVLNDIVNDNRILSSNIYNKVIKIYAKSSTDLPNSITCTIKPTEITTAYTLDLTFKKYEDTNYYIITLNDIFKYINFIKANSNIVYEPLFKKAKLYYENLSIKSNISDITSIDDFINMPYYIVGTYYPSLYFINKNFFDEATANLLKHASDEVVYMLNDSLSTITNKYMNIYVSIDNKEYINDNSVVISNTEGMFNTAYGVCSHAEGINTKSLEQAAHTEGEGTIALNISSHAGGYCTIADIDKMTAIGSYNKPNHNIYTNSDQTIFVAQTIIDGKNNITQANDGTYTATLASGYTIEKLTLYTSGEETLQNKIFVVGNGTSNDNRKNAFVITDTGDVYISGTIHCKEIIHDM